MTANWCSKKNVKSFVTFFISGFILIGALNYSATKRAEITNSELELVPSQIENSARVYDSNLLSNYETELRDQNLPRDVLGHRAVSEQFGKVPLYFEQIPAAESYKSRAQGYDVKLSAYGIDLEFAAKTGALLDDELKYQDQQPEIENRLSEIENLTIGGIDVGKPYLANKYVGIRFKNGNLQSTLQPLSKSKTKLHYLLGDDKKQWRTNVPTYSQIKATNVYEGIDIIYRGNQARLQYDFVLAPGANPNKIRLDYSGADNIATNEQGDLVLTIGDKAVIQHKPYIYQTTDRGNQTQVDGHYVINADNSVSIAVPEYDIKLALVIDPVLQLSSYIGNSLYDYARAIKLDSQDNIIIAGITSSGSAVLPNALGTGIDGGFDINDLGNTQGSYDIYVAKLNPDLSEVDFVTVLGGTKGDFVRALTLDNNDNIYFTGDTHSSNMPLQDPVLNSKQTPVTTSSTSYGDTYVAKLSPNGDDLLFGSYLGGDYQEYASGIHVDANGFLAVTGSTRSADYPMRNQINAGGFNFNYDAYVTIINTGDGPNPNASLSSTGFTNPQNVVFSSLVGGSSADYGYAVRLLPNNELVVVGNTYSRGIASSYALKTTNPHGLDGYAARIDYVNGDQLLFTYLDQFLPAGEMAIGTETINGIDEEVVYLGGGWHNYSPNIRYPALTKFKSDFGEKISTTILGSSHLDSVKSIALGPNNTTHIIGNSYSGIIPERGELTIGQGSSTNLPAEDESFNQTTLNTSSAQDVFYSIVDQTGALVFSSVYGSESDNEYVYAIDANDNNEVFIVGATSSTQFPTLNAIQPQFAGNQYDGFVLKISPDNQAPEITSIPITDGAIQNLYQYQVEATDPNDDPLSYALITAPAGMTIDSNGLITWQPIVIGTESVTVQVSDDRGASVTQDFVITVISLNSPPSITSTPVTNAIANVGYSYQVSATDPDGDNLSYSLTIAPVGMAINSSSGLITWQPLAGGDFNVNVLVTDGAGGSANQSFTITVIVDDTPPELLISAPDNNVTTTDQGIEFVGSVSENANVIATVNGISESIILNNDLTFNSPLNLNQGENDITIVAVDPAGNESNEFRITLYLDSIPPEIPLADEIFRDYSINGSVTVTGNNGSVESDATVRIINTTTQQQVEVLSDSIGFFRQEITAQDSDTIRIVVIDAVGNESNPVDILPLTISTLALPIIENQQLEVGERIQLFVGAEVPPGEEVIYNATPIPLPDNMFFDRASGEFKFEPKSGQESQSHTITISAQTDTESVSQQVTFTVDPASGPTRLTGRVLTSNRAPLANVRLELGGYEVFTDAAGDFQLLDIPAGPQRLLIDGSTVDPALGTYATVPEIFEIVDKGNNRVDPPIYLLPLDIASADPVDPNAISIIESSPVQYNGNTYPPVRLTIPPQTAYIEETGELYDGVVHITNMEDATLSPRPLPEDLGASVYVAVQPFGVCYQQPVPVSFPNIEGFAPGDIMEVFGLNHATGKMEKQGEAMVSEDGNRVDSIGGVFKCNSWHSVGSLPPVNDEGNADGADDGGPNGDCGGCYLSLDEGILKEWHSVPTYSSLGQIRSLRLVYKNTSANPSPIINMDTDFGVGTPLALYMTNRITVGNVAQGILQYNQPNLTQIAIPFGNKFAPTRPTFQFDAGMYNTGVYEYVYRMNCIFPRSSRAQRLTGEVIIQNEINSPFGAGWTLEGLQRLHVASTGSILLVEGDGRAYIFEDIENDTLYSSPPGDYSQLVKNANGSFTRTMKDGMRYDYDESGVMQSATDRNGNTTIYQYDGQDRVNQVIDPVGLSYVINYAGDKIESITDPSGRVTQFLHDTSGNLTTIIEPNGDNRSFEYDDRHLLISQLDQRGNIKEYGYNFAGRVIRASLPDGSSIGISPSQVIGLMDLSTGLGTDENNLGEPPPLLRDVESLHTDNNGNITRISSDHRGATLQEIDAIYRATDYERDEDSNPTRISLPSNLLIENTFDDRGNVLSTTDTSELGDLGILERTATYAYDGFSLLSEYTNRRGFTTTLERDSNGNMTRYVNALGHVTTLTYNNLGLVSSMADPDGLSYTYEYNAQQLLFKITQTPPATSTDAVRITSYQYDAAGNRTQVITPDGIVLNNTFDSKGRLITSTDNLNNKLQYGYNGINLVETINVFDPDNALARTMLNEYDVRNRLIKIQTPHADDTYSITSFNLDGNSNLTGITDPRSNSDSNIYDALERLTQTDNAEGGITEFSYDNNDLIIGISGPNGAHTSYTRDQLGRVLEENSPDRGMQTYEYDKNNNVTTMTDARNITATYSYDELDRVISVSYPNTQENVTYGYDTCQFGIGRVCSRTDETGSYEYQYDIFGNQIKVTFTITEGTSFVTEYVYDQGDNVVSMTYPTGRVVNYTRDAIRRIQGIRTVVNNVEQTLVSNIQYRSDNLATSRTFGNGIVDNRNYDLQGRLISQTLELANINLDERNYVHDENGNIVNRNDSIQQSEHEYDLLDRLITDRLIEDSIVRQDLDYSYDLNGNRILVSNNINTNYQVETGLVVNGGKETNRNAFKKGQEQIVDRTANNVNEKVLAYNNVGRLTQLIYDGTVIGNYIYNANGLRVRKVTDVNNTNRTVIYHYNMYGQLIAETDTAGNTIKEYIWANGEPCVQYDVANPVNELVYLHSDHLMTIRLATNTNGNIIWRWQGDAFGASEPDQDPDLDFTTTEINLRFPGQYYDAESNLFYNWNRYYDPTSAKYITSDPVGLTAGINTYGYVEQNPGVGYDSDGLNPAWAGRAGWTFGRVVVNPALNAGARYLANRLGIAGVGTLGGLAYELLNEKADDRPDNNSNPQDYLDSITNEQKGKRKRRPKINDEDNEWDGANTSPENNDIWSTDKAKQKNKHWWNKDYDWKNDSDENCE